jgi:hypothetical protein
VRHLPHLKSVSVEMAKRSSKKRRGPGRPPTTGIGKLVGIRCHKEFLTRVDKWRAAQGGISRPDAIRKLAEMGLATVDE